MVTQEVAKSHSGPSSLCEAFSQANIPAKSKWPQNGLRRAQIEEISSFIVGHMKQMEHAKEFKALFNLSSDPKEFFNRFETVKTTILAQTKIFQTQFAKKKYQKIKSEIISPEQIQRINNLVSSLIEDVKNINAAEVFTEMFKARIKKGTVRILQTDDALDSLPKKTTKEKDNQASFETEQVVNNFFKNIADHIFKEEQELYESYRKSLSLNNDELDHKEFISSTAKETYETYLKNVRTKSSELFRKYSIQQMESASEKAKPQVNDIVMYTKDKNSDTTYFGRVLKIEEKTIKIRNSNGTEETLTQDRIVPFIM